MKAIGLPLATLAFLSLGVAGYAIAFELAYPVIAWLCRVPNLLVAERLVKNPGARTIQA